MHLKTNCSLDPSYTFTRGENNNFSRGRGRSELVTGRNPYCNNPSSHPTIEAQNTPLQGSPQHYLSTERSWNFHFSTAIKLRQRTAYKHKEQITARLESLQNVIPGLSNSNIASRLPKKGRRSWYACLPTKWTTRCLLRNSKLDKVFNVSSFEDKWLGPYEIHEVLNKGVYRLGTIPKEGETVKYFKKPVNWARLRRFLKKEEDGLVTTQTGKVDLFARFVLCIALQCISCCTIPLLYHGVCILFLVYFCT